LLAAPTLLPRALVVLSLIAGVLYPLAEPTLAALPAKVTAKGICVGLIAAAAALRARDTDGWLLAGMLAAGTLGDVLLAVPGLFAAGAGAFAIGHGLAIILYRRNRATGAVASRKLTALALLAVGLLTPWLMLPPGPARIGVAIYAALLGAMAATATLSRFAAIVPLGAVMFLVSDALIGARLGHVIADGTASGLAVWWLYYFGQLLIFTGVRRTLRGG
jgi:uncharacterized membrane protein YhhN